MVHQLDEASLHWVPVELHSRIRAAEPEALALARVRLLTTLTQLAPHIPPLMLQALVAADTAHPAPGAMQRSGSLLCIELAGMPQLLDELALAGRAGSEEVSQLVNQVLTGLVEAIGDWGGSVLQSDGSRLTAFFDAQLLGEQHTSYAAAVALQLHQSLRTFATYPTSKGPYNLDLRIALHQGSLFLVEVGDNRRRVLLTTGQAINQATALLASAASGELLASKQMVQALPDAQVTVRAEASFLLHGLPQLPQPPSLPIQPLVQMDAQPGLDQIQRLAGLLSHLAAYLPVPWSELTAGGQLINEFRPVTVVYANFYAFHRLLTLLTIPALVEDDRSLIADTLQLYYAHMQAAIYDHGGQINKIDMAAFGNRLFALFGAPRVHEDDAERALLAARALHAASGQAQKEIGVIVQNWIADHPNQRGLRNVLGLPIPQRIGVASGPVFAGLIGAPTRHEYSVVGGTTSLAARLQNRARDGETLVAGHTQRMVATTITMVPLPPIELDGFAHPVPVFRLPRDDVAPEPIVLSAQGKLVGRTSELEQLLALSALALHNEDGGRVVAITGEPGIGKTRLADELVGSLRMVRPKLRIVRAASQRYDSNEPYSLIASVLLLLFDMPPATVAEQIKLVEDRLTELVPSWSRFTPLLGPLLNLPIAESALTKSLPLQQRSERLEELIVALCKAMAVERPLILVLDNLHWSDRSSHTVITRLAEGCAGAPLFLVLLYRQVQGFAEPWRTLAITSTIELTQLSVREGRRLTDELLGAPAPAALYRVLERSGGSPLFLSEMVQYLIDAARLEVINSRWVYHEVGLQAPISARIEQLIVAHLDLLSSESRRLLDVVAAAGSMVEARLLSLIPTAAPLLSDHLGPLLQMGLLLHVSSDEQVAYTFRQPLVHDVTYDSLLFARRHALHAEIATALEDQYPDQAARPRAWLARQWQAAAQPERAFPYFLAAAQEAQARYANTEALALYEQVLATIPMGSAPQGPAEQARFAALKGTIGDVQALTGEYIEARNSYQQGLALLDASADLAGFAALERKMSATYEHQGDYEQALHWLVQAAARLVHTVDEQTIQERGRVLSELGWLYFRRGDAVAARPSLEEALALFIQAGDPADLGRVLNRLGGVIWEQGDLARARQAVEQSLAASEQSDNLLGQAEALGNLSNLAESQGQFDAALSYGQRAADLLERIGSRRQLAMALINVGWSYYNLGRYAEAQRYTTEAVQLANAVDDKYHAVIALLNLGRIAIELQNWPAAEFALAQSFNLAEQLELPNELLYLFVARGELALRSGNLEQAYRYEALAHEVAPEGDLLSIEQVYLLRLQGELALAEGDPQRAHELLSLSIARFDALHNPAEALRTHRLLQR